MNKLDVTVYCTKPMLLVHYHPHLMHVAGQGDKPHLGEPHDHHVKVTVRMRCEHLERDKDLLLLHAALEKATEYPKRAHMGQASFEQIAVIMRERVIQHAQDLGDLGRPVIYAVEIAAHDEGAEVKWERDQ